MNTIRDSKLMSFMVPMSKKGKENEDSRTIIDPSFSTKYQRKILRYDMVQAEYEEEEVTRES